MNVIETEGLTRYFAVTPAVVELDLAVPRGSIFGLLGENGCGKTTTINLIMGALIPNQGTVSVLGEDPASMTPATRSRIGYLADEMALPGWMRLAEALGIHGSFFPQWDRDEAWRLMKAFELSADQPFGTLSKGQKRRFLIALILAQRPDLLILDEPSGGLDASVRRQFLDLLIENAAEREITILIASHILSDVERVVDHVAFVKAGRVARQASLEDLKASVKRLCLSMDTPRHEIERRFEILASEKKEGAWLATVGDFDAARLDGIECQVEHLNLEELFLLFNNLAGKEAVAS